MSRLERVWRGRAFKLVTSDRGDASVVPEEMSLY